MVSVFIQSLLSSIILFLFAFKFFKGKFFRWGGVILIIVFVGLVLVHRELEITRQLLGVLIGSGAILLFGVWDDYKNLSWKVQMLFQICLIGVLIYFGFGVDYFTGISGESIRIDYWIWQGVSIGSIAFIFFWVISIINAINWSDGVDSSMGGIALIGGLSLVFISFLPEVNQPAIAILASIFLGSLVGFLIFNLPPARVEAGTAGSYFVGFILASLAIIAGSKIITVMIVLVLPLIDFVWVIIERWKNKQSIFQKDKKHLHYKLRNIGWSDVKIFLSYIIFLGSILILYSVLDNRIQRVVLLVVETITLIIIMMIVNLEEKKHKLRK